MEQLYKAVIQFNSNIIEHNFTSAKAGEQYTVTLSGQGRSKEILHRHNPKLPFHLQEGYYIPNYYFKIIMEKPYAND